MNKYQYAPLTSPRQLRLLKLHPGATTDELSGELVHTSLDTEPRFLALSYAWGDSQPRKAIRCSGCTVEIGPSLHSALRHLRQPDHDILLWADALCINQEDVPERSQQVRIMGEIYSAASYTAIWLGEKSDEVQMAFEWLRRFSLAWNALDCDMPASNNPDFISRGMGEKALQVAFGEHRVTAFRGIWALLNCPWFTRKWVVQELVKSHRPMMVAGREVLPWTSVADWMNLVQGCPHVRQTFMLSCSEPVQLNAKVPEMTILRATLLTRVAEPQKYLLLFLILKMLEFRCADSRDHIFALLGIASDADRFDLIDYGSPMESIYRKLAYACNSDSMNLKLFSSLVYLAPLERRIRSWLPNIESVLADKHGAILASQFSIHQHRNHNASGDTVLRTQLDNSGNFLTIRGRIVDRLKLLGSERRASGDASTFETMVNKNAQSYRHNIQSMQRQRCEWLEECLVIVKTTNVTNHEKAFQNTLLGDWIASKDAHQSLEVIRSEFSTQRRLYHAMAYEKEYGTWLAAVIRSMNLGSSHLLEIVLAEQIHRRFGSTENGRIGWLPPVAKEGDFICIFDGMELPYAIRPAVNGRYHLIGECTIQGLMMGEGVNSSDAVPENFILE